MPEYNPYADLYADLAGDVFDAGAAILPPMSGASPGLFEDLQHIGGDVLGYTLNPALSFLGGVTGGVVKDAWAAAEAAWHRVTYHVYTLVFSAFQGMVNTPTSIRFFNPENVKFLSSHWFLGETFRLIVATLDVLKGWGLEWLRDRTREFLGYAGYGFGSLVNWTEAALANVQIWVKDRVWEFLGYAAYGFGSLFQGIASHVSAAGVWVKDRIWEFLGYGALGFGTLASWIGAALGNAQTWVKDRVSELLGLALWGFPSMIAAVHGLGTASATWLRDRIYDGLGHLAKGFPNMAAFVERKLSDFGTWIYDHIGAPILAEVKKAGAAIVSGAQDIAGFFADGLAWVFNNLFEPFIGFIEKKMAIPMKFVRGEYAHYRDFVEDIMDPPVNVLKAPLMFFGYVLVAILSNQLLQSTAFQPMYSKWAADTWQDIGGNIMTTQNTYDAWNRGLVDDAGALWQLERQGYSGRELQAIKGLRYQMPGESDLVRFGVREVFTPEIAQRFGQFEGFPSGFGEAMAKLGYRASGAGSGDGSSAPGGRSWAEAYWAAHWQLPSITQAFEMYQRRVKLRDGGTFDDASLDMLLRAQDVMPYWRETLKQIAYNPLTRVDIRRMYHARVLTEQEVYNAYLDVGYNAVNARRLTDFTKLNYAPDDATTGVKNRELTASLIRESYRRHVITRDDAAARLIDVGYDAEETEFQLDIDDARLAQNPTGDAAIPVRDLTTGALMEAYRERVLTRAQVTTELTVMGYAGNEITVLLSLEDLQVSRAWRNARAGEVRERYIGRAVDYATALTQLTEIGIPGDRAQFLVAEWGADFRRGERKLTVAEVFNALKFKYFTNEQALAYLRRLGYNDADSGILMRLRTGG
jgi:hypothetical protein